MKLYIILLSICLSIGELSAQSQIDHILRSISENNRELKANGKLTESKKLEAKIGNTLPDPTVSYDHLWGSPSQLGKSKELNVQQSFDFPSLYAHRNRLSKQKAVLYDRQYETTRQQILLNAKELCIDIIALNKQHALQLLRQQNAYSLVKFYQERVKRGDANILETNKIEMELLNVKTEIRQTLTTRTAKLKELQMLNGDIPVIITDTTFIPVALPTNKEEWKQEALSADPSMQSLLQEKDIALRELKLSKSQWIPKFELGYRREKSLDENFNGISFGVSIPLYENRNRIKQAKALAAYSDLQISSAAASNQNVLDQLYSQAASLKKSIEEYRQVLNSQHTIDLLNKALKAGQISMIEYFTETTLWYQSLSNYIQLENEYQKTMAQLYKYRL
ncbi:TolC family protein [Coprobacter tertius]|uniref:TolC family protein n=1 Tax=Coprobacter tertius TaxID=2944915 RepID=A0ABT1MHQ1_9BACT|nr:TolC family protein [Coprobacter tertius]MCP9611574.1 TolC family protein [Coprobacter tertius]